VLHAPSLSLQREAQEIHADQAGLFVVRHFSKHGLVADGDAVLVGAHLRAPHPERLSEQHRIGVFELGNFHVGALDGAMSRMISSGDTHDVMRFVWFPIGILAEERNAVGAESDNRITHGAAPFLADCGG
jgi:hypothetical protein